MTENKVTLDLQKYDQLREFEKAVTEDKFIFQRNWDGLYYSLKENEFITKLKKENESLNKELRELKNPKDELTLEDVKKMNLFSVIRWKISRRK
jgi:hypothetical protein